MRPEHPKHVNDSLFLQKSCAAKLADDTRMPQKKMLLWM